jgi:hypothetical protein
MKRKKHNLFQKIALGLIFSLGFFALLNILGTAKAENATEEIITEEVITEEEKKLNQDGTINYGFLPSGIFISGNDSDGNSTLLANINIKNAKIISQDKNKLKISFDIFNNNPWVQTNLKFEIGILPFENFENSSFPAKGEINKAEKAGEISWLYPEPISLKGNAKENKIVEHEFPNYLVGKYVLFVKAFLPNGLFLGGDVLNKHPLSLGGNNQFIEIVPSSCQLFTETQEEENNTSQKEGQVAICEAINHFEEPIKATPYFEIYRRSQYGEKIKEFISDRGEFYFEPGEKQNIALDLPVNFDPQSYAAKVVLKKDGEIISNKVVIYYMLEGVSATIQNVNFDRESYKQGETAKVRLFWSDTPKLFEKRANIEYLQTDLIFKNGDTDQICGQVVKDLDAGKIYEEILVPIEKDCPNPIILTSLKNKEGKILFQQESQILEEKGSNFSYSGKIFLKDKNYILIFALIAISVVALIIFLILFIKINKIKK